MGIIALKYQGSGFRSSSLQDKYFAYCPISPALCLKKKNNNNGSLSKTKIWVQEIHQVPLLFEPLLLLEQKNSCVGSWGRGGTMHVPSGIAPHVTTCVCMTLTLCSCPHLPANPPVHMTHSGPSPTPQPLPLQISQFLPLPPPVLLGKHTFPSHPVTCCQVGTWKQGD